jgi:hypothetical protein
MLALSMKERRMPVVLYDKGYDYARKLIKEGRVDRTERNWMEANPSSAESDEYIRSHTLQVWGLWHLAINTDHNPNTKAYYEFPYGDFVNVCRSGVIAAEARAGQYKHLDIEAAAKDLLNKINK